MMIMKTAPMPKRKPPENRVRRVFFLIAESKAFENFIMVSIILNTLVLGVTWYRQPEWVD